MPSNLTAAPSPLRAGGVEVLLRELPVRVDADVVAGHTADALLGRVLAHPASAGDLGLLERIDPDALSSKKLQLAYARRVDEVLACGSALQVRVTAVLAGPAPSGQYLAEVAAETEISLARSVSPTRAGLDIELARALTATFPAFLTALEQGRTSVAHCRRLVETTRLITDAHTLEVIGTKALGPACRLTPGKFADRLDALVAEHDPDAPARMTRAVETSRDCTVQRMRDGMGRLVYVDSWVKVNAVGARIRSAGRATQRHRRNPTRPNEPTAAPTTDSDAASTPDSAAPARRRPTRGEPRRPEELVLPTPGTAATPETVARAGEADASGDCSDAALEWATDAGSCRADAMLALTLGTDTADGVVLDAADMVRVEVQVVIDLETLRGEADHLALVDGAPVPGSVGPDWARRARTYRRMVTDPVTGHLIDKGRTYLADDVRDFVLARDGGCRIPTCGIRHHDRLQADHATPYPAGPTSAANLGALSTTHHLLKTAGHLDITDSAADGSATLTTAWGQRIHIPPRPYLREPDPPPTAEPPPGDETPPF